jgi:hypothetical protein
VPVVVLVVVLPLVVLVVQRHLEEVVLVVRWVNHLRL